MPKRRRPAVDGLGPPALSRVWFADWLYDKFTVAQLREATERHATLASKFRTGAAFPRAVHLEALARRTGHPELVLGGIAFLDEFAPLRQAVRDVVVGGFGDAGLPEVPARLPGVLDRQLDRRLAAIDAPVDVVHATGPVLLLVPDGHGTSALARRLDARVPSTRFVLDLSTSAVEDAKVVDQVRAVRGDREITVVAPQSRERQVKLLPVDGVPAPSPSWAEVFEEVFGRPPSVDLAPLGGTLIDALPLDLVRIALIEYYRRTTQPAVLGLEPIDSRPSPTTRLKPRPLTAVQESLLAPALMLAQPAWGIVVDEQPGLSASVAQHVAARAGGTILLGDEGGLPTVLRAWAELLERPKSWPQVLDRAREKASLTFVLDLDIGTAHDASLIAAMLQSLQPQVPDARWFLCGTNDQVRVVASHLWLSVAVVKVCGWPVDLKDTAVGDRPTTFDLLRDPAQLTVKEVRAHWYDGHWNLEQQLYLLARSAIIEISVGQGGSAGCRALMVIRSDIDRAQALVTLDDHLRHDRAESVLAKAGFVTTRPEGSFAPNLVGSPFLYTVRPMNDPERQRLADAASQELFGEPADVVEDDAVLYVDLSPTRYGRVPVAGEGWNDAERLTPTYVDIARRLLERVAGRAGQTFVFVPPGLYDADLFPPRDWELYTLPSLPGAVLEELWDRHGARHDPAPQLRCSIATADVRRFPKPRSRP